ncbi:hypothetical protein G2W53_026410 [Senna tora]|uniref:Transposase-associated domain-containing protein n=1 Tax=Senna tora TaxID=362788 RepID=A0A834WF26_9FABA|nr:hypothetical protein G2W53_026410 [Senna tora]
MDKSWITMSRVSPEYEKGLNAFLDFAFAHTIVKGKIRCACSCCGFKRWHTREVVYDHLICTQFPHGYTIWTFHGESLIGDASNTSNISQDRITDIGGLPDQDQMQDMVREAVGFNRNVEIEANEFIDEVESTVHGFQPEGFASIPDDVSKQCNKYWKVDIIDEQGVVRDGRLKVLEVWSLPAGQRVVVHFNAEAQPVGNAAGLLSGFLGIVVTEVNTFPISYRSWDKVPDSYKEACFNSIKAKFCLDRDIDKHFVIKKLGKNWRNYRVFLFGRFYKVEKTREQNLEKYPQFIPFDMWAAFVDYRLEQKTKVVFL